ncbi:MAG: hypothetical protein U1F43_01130 [Myxococcota bacterium]
MVLRAHVEHGKIIADAPEGYTDGMEIEIAIVDDLGMDAEERAELEASIEQGERDFEAGRFVDAREFLARLRAQKP